MERMYSGPRSGSNHAERRLETTIASPGFPGRIRRLDSLETAVVIKVQDLDLGLLWLDDMQDCNRHNDKYLEQK